jgi:hypothetical protein
MVLLVGALSPLTPLVPAHPWPPPPGGVRSPESLVLPIPPQHTYLNLNIQIPKAT